MSLRKRCSQNEPAVLADGSSNPLNCAKSPRCDHHWHYDFRVNRRRYRGTTETADKGKAKDIEAKERSRILDGRHSIRRQPDITFRQFADEYLRDYAEQHKRSAARDRAIVAVLNRTFGNLILHEITPHRILQWQRDRRAGTWQPHGSKTVKPIQPATVNRELDALRAMLSKAVQWGKLLANPCATVPRLKVNNVQTRTLSPDEQERLLSAAPGKVRAMIALALVTGARLGSELLTLRWAQVAASELVFLETKNGTPRAIPMTDSIRVILGRLPRSGDSCS